jgi:ubiquitin C-terminal hydrolase
LVDFPIENLDLSTYVRGPKHPEAPPVYDLYAVSQHSGGLGGGHYTALCKNPIDGNWYNFNDSFVSETTAQSAVNEMAYVLFYRRKTGGVKWAGVTPLEHPGLPDED